MMREPRPAPGGGAPTPAEMRRLIDGQLSVPSRMAYVGLLLAALLVTVAVASLWLTEPALPARTQAGFGLITLIGTCWIAFSAWILTRTRPLLAPHRIVAARMGLGFSLVFAAAALILGLGGGGRAAYAACGAGLAMAGIAAALLVRAGRALAHLQERRAALLRELRG